MRDAGLPGQNRPPGLTSRRFCNTSRQSAPWVGLRRSVDKTDWHPVLSHRYRAPGTAMKKPDDVPSASQAWLLESNHSPTIEGGTTCAAAGACTWPKEAPPALPLRNPALPTEPAANSSTGRA